ncbi:MAG: hypothetical protein QNJ72_01215 [Pleurocapsa sp. MO_226.B13]|nr:hypothetical protein [Pleurocapsa sp. MO_226.B13]
MPNHYKIVKEIKRVESTIFNVQRELKTLKNRVRAYKGWTKRYRQQQKELQKEITVLKSNNKIVCQQRDEQSQEVKQKQTALLNAVRDAKIAQESRDKALLELENVIARIDEFKQACDRINQITYANKADLIKEAEKLLFEEEIIDDELNLDEREYPQMFTDPASINRSLLN